MGTLKHYLLATVGLAILVGGFTLLGPAVPQGQAVPPAKDVNVVNTPLSVDLATTANVNIVNDEANPVPVVVQGEDGDASEPMEFLVEVRTPTPVDLFTVPSGKRLVITDVIVQTDTSKQKVEIQRNGVIVSQPSAAPIYSHTISSSVVWLWLCH